MGSAPVQSPQSPGSIRLHHVGFVVASILESVGSFTEPLCASWDEKIFLDPIQKVRVTFLQGAHFDDAQVELIEPAEPDSPVSRFLERGGGLHHLCYEVADLERHLAHCRSAGTIVIRPPVPAVAFGGRRIAWAMTKGKLLVEFLEAKLR
jgi:methylmalonyl-CoA/ethylmalonyl-CoA epimerase